MRWLVTGATGMLGRDLQDVLAEREVTAAGHADLDVTDAGAVAAAVPGHDVVVNAAAWTAVDDTETHEPDAFAVNALGTANLSSACAAAGALFVHMSTDYVFDGHADLPYPEDALPAPASAYGRTKAAGEWAARGLHPAGSYVVRTAWLYGEHGNSFVRTVLRLAAAQDRLRMVDDQTGQPTWSRDVAARIVAMIDAGAPPGTYHATSAGRTTWYGLARRVLELIGEDPDRVSPTTTAEFPRPAPRPAWSVLGHDAWARAGLGPMRAWEDALAEALPLVVAAQAREASSA